MTVSCTCPVVDPDAVAIGVANEDRVATGSRGSGS